MRRPKRIYDRAVKRGENMKKITTLVLAVLLAMSVAACGESASTQTASASESAASAVSQTEEKSKAAATETQSATEDAETSEVTEAPSESVTPAPEETEDTEEEEPVLSEEAMEIEKALLPVVEGEYELSDCIKLGNYKGLEAEYVYTEVTDEEVEETIASYAVAETLDDPEATVEEGVTVDIDYAGYIDGEQVSNATGNINTLVIGSGTFIEGFEEGLIGMKVGEERDLDLRFPDDYWNADMASKDITFHVTLNSISVIPEVTDEWVSELTEGEYTTVEEFRAELKRMLQEQADQSAQDAVESDIWNQVFENCEFYQVPKDVVDSAFQRYYDNYNQYAMQYGVELSDFLTMYYGISTLDFEVYAKQYAENIAKSQLLRDALWEAEGLSTEDESYAKYQQELADTYGISVEELYSYFGEEEVDGYCRTYCDVERVMSYANITGYPED